MPLLATAPLVEAFASVQGEGPHVGEATLFVRTAGCPLRCTYCDTTESYQAPAAFALRDLAGRELATWENPSSLDVFGERLFRLADEEGMRWLSLTGGEPTLWPEFGRALFAQARARGLRTHLETAAQDVESFEAFLDCTDFASLDWKFPSTLHGAKDWTDAHVACVRVLASRGTPSSVKAVLTPGVTDHEWGDMLHRLRKYQVSFTLVLQPVTPCLDEPRALSTPELLRRVREALRAGFDLRVLPQIHKAMGIA